MKKLLLKSYCRSFVSAILLFSAFSLHLYFSPCLSHADANPSKFRGWDLLANRLIKDGIPEDFVSNAFRDERLPAFNFVPFKLKPKESDAIYEIHIEQPRIARAKEYLDTYKKAFDRAERHFGVNRYLIAAIHSIETGCGRVLGQELVFNRLARVASAGDTQNLQRNFQEQSAKDKSITFEALQNRAAYLEETFYPEVRALFQEAYAKRLSLFELRGSVGGAFGIGQFLPLSFQKFGTDGNGNGIVSLFEPEDAIFSTARFLHSYGWKESLPPGDKLRLLWKYNRSDPYGRAAIKLSVLLRSTK